MNERLCQRTVDSILTNLLETLEPWTRMFEERLGSNITYLQCRKAFDRFSHQK